MIRCCNAPRAQPSATDLHRHRLAGAHGARHLRRAFKKKLGLTIVSDKAAGGGERDSTASPENEQASFGEARSRRAMGLAFPHQRSYRCRD